MSDPLSRLRELCLALPEVTERLDHGEPACAVRDRALVTPKRPVARLG